MPHIIYRTALIQYIVHSRCAYKSRSTKWKFMSIDTVTLLHKCIKKPFFLRRRYEQSFPCLSKDSFPFSEQYKFTLKIFYVMILSVWCWKIVIMSGGLNLTTLALIDRHYCYNSILKTMCCFPRYFSCCLSILAAFNLLGKWANTFFAKFKR